MGQTVVEKVAQAHLAEGPRDRGLRSGDFLSIRPRHVMTHDNTAPVMKKFRAIGAARIKNPKQPRDTPPGRSTQQLETSP